MGRLGVRGACVGGLVCFSLGGKPAMQTHEVAAVRQRYLSRVAAMLSADQLALFEAYERRVQAAIERRDPAPIAIAPGEQAVLEHIAADTQAAALRAQLDTLLRIETPPQ